MNERHRVSSFDCDHQPQGSQPEHRTYPVLLKRRVTPEEADLIDEWLRKRRGE